MNSSETELQLLEAINASRDDPATLSQRDMAEKAGLSLGMTNVLLKRFVERGWVKLLHISRRQLSYILTGEGIEEVLRRSVSYFARASSHAGRYRERIDEYVRRIAREGYESLVLTGPAELDFLFEYACMRHGMEFAKNPHGALKDTLLARTSTMVVDTRLSGLHVDKAVLDAASQAVSGLPPQECPETDFHAGCVHITEVLFPA